MVGRVCLRGPDLDLNTEEQQIAKSPRNVTAETLEFDMSSSREALLKQLNEEMSQFENEQMAKANEYCRKFECDQTNKTMEHAKDERIRLLQELEISKLNMSEEVEIEVATKKSRLTKRIVETFDEDEYEKTLLETNELNPSEFENQLKALQEEQIKLNEELKLLGEKKRQEKETIGNYLREDISQSKSSLEQAKKERDLVYAMENQIKEKIKQTMRDYIIRAELAAQLDAPVVLAPSDVKILVSPRNGSITSTTTSTPPPQQQQYIKQEVVFSTEDEEIYSSDSDDDSVYIQNPQMRDIAEETISDEEYEDEEDDREENAIATLEMPRADLRKRSTSTYIVRRTSRTYAFRQSFLVPNKMRSQSDAEQQSKSKQSNQITFDLEPTSDQSSESTDLKLPSDENMIHSAEHVRVEHDDTTESSAGEQEGAQEPSNVAPPTPLKTLPPVPSRKSLPALPSNPSTSTSPSLLPAPPKKALPSLPTKRLLKSQIDILLDDPQARAILQEYAIEGFCAESIMCWTDIQYYKRLYGNELRYKKTKFIYDQYLCQKSAPLLLNLPNFKKYNAPIEKILSLDYQSAQPEVFDGLFDRLEKQVKIEMFDLFLRFQKTSQYKKLLKTIPELLTATQA
ncbi:regulator of G-protein signaling [Acrasis kona]|uniref:Regulator of G-protein signaling n=1 Tax=Acrasis kona TaxID=1008807 RepID=A0AAW2YLW4_9EUKA